MIDAEGCKDNLLPMIFLMVIGIVLFMITVFFDGDSLF